VDIYLSEMIAPTTQPIYRPGGSLTVGINQLDGANKEKIMLPKDEEIAFS
jgi:hypothetical protein